MISTVKILFLIGITSALASISTIKSPEENYQEFCASCHGAKMEAFADRGWKYGKDLPSISKSISIGYPDGGMPAFSETFTTQEVEALASYLKQGLEARESYDFSESFDTNQEYSYLGLKVKVEEVTRAADKPWGMAFLPTGGMLVTDRDGDLYLHTLDGEDLKIKNVPDVVARGQGGLMDVEIHPDFAKNSIIYLSYSKRDPEGDGQTTAIYMAVLEGQNLVDGQDIYIATPYFSTRHHYGSRIDFGPDGKLYFSVGDRGKRNENPQSLDNSCGKIHRINEDGSIPSDNPFIDQKGAIPSIWSYGHRNPQGLVWDLENQILWTNEHGPRGGDEINSVEKGKNYGWPVISYGINYSGTAFTEKTHQDGMEQPTHYWIPSIGVCGLTIVKGDKYPGWNNYLLSGSLRFDYISMIKDNPTDPIDEEIKLLPNIGRLRSIAQDHEGYLYVGVEEPGRVYKIVSVD